MSAPAQNVAPLTGEHQRPHRRVSRQGVEQFGQRPPHRGRHGVALGRVVDDDVATESATRCSSWGSMRRMLSADPLGSRGRCERDRNGSHN